MVTYAQDCALLPKWEITKVQPDSTLWSFLESVRNDVANARHTE